MEHSIKQISLIMQSFFCSLFTDQFFTHTQNTLGEILLHCKFSGKNQGDLAVLGRVKDSMHTALLLTTMQVTNKSGVTGYIVPSKKIQAYLILLCFFLYCFADILFFTNWSFVATLHRPRLWVPFLQLHLLTLFLCVTFW